MKYDDDEKFTIIPKFIGGRKTRDLIDILKILFVVFTVIGAFGVGQVLACKHEHPGREILACLRMK